MNQRYRQAYLVMAPKHLLSVFFSLLLFMQINSSTAQTVVKSAYWFPASEFPQSSIDSSLFTHLFCAFANLDPQTNQVVIASSDTSSFSTFTKTVQQKNSNVKTLLSIGGGSSNPATFASMASKSDSRKAFIDSSIKLARSYGFYGLDLDWEYPTASADMTNLGLLLTEWRTAVTTESQNSGKAALLLTAAVSYSPRVNGLNYPSDSIAKNFDWINLMAYDFSAPARSQVTRSHAALYDPASQLSGSYGVEAWIQAGVPAKKLVLGFPFYGYSWKLVNAQNHGLYAPASGTTGSGDGSIGYNQIKTFITQNSATSVYNSTMVTDYAYSGTTWIGFDDTQTISTKVAYAKQKGLLGYFAWHVGVDNNWALSRQASQAWGA